MKLLIKLFLAALLLFPFLSFAQSNFKPGYIVGLKGDTIRGLIDLKDGLYPQNITFKRLAGAPSQLFTPNDIKYAGVDNTVTFMAYTGPISTDRTEISKLEIDRNTGSKNASVFLRLEQDGPNVNLFSFVDNLKTRYFVNNKQDGQPVELSYRVYFSSTQNNLVKTEEGYRAQLLELVNKYAADNTNLLDRIERAKYNSDDLGSIIREINHTKAGKSTSGKSSLGFFVGVALNSASFKPVGTFFPFYNPKSHTSIFPKISFGLNIYPNPAVGKLMFKLEASFTRNSYKTDIDSYTDGRPLSKSTYAFDQNNIVFSPQIQYHLYNGDDFKFYINGGGALNFSSYKGNSFRNNYLEQVTENALETSATWISVPVKAGVVLGKKLDAGITYIFPVKPVEAIKISSVQVGLSYLFR
ncbi:MAG: hypothetical protein AAGC65_11760 [Mucilaginibacter sp.]|uniref:hypothetical protein n=1 Tax=Mucilaginibacter sp. TaxID=1882438 RepID=UPI0031A7B6A2